MISISLRKTIFRLSKSGFKANFLKILINYV